MSKIKLTKGLQLNKESLSKLQENQMNAVKGGKVFSSSGPACTCRDNSCKDKEVTVDSL
ncbi:class I lanthipeptide [Tenacibaculum sp. TC6]|uniref:class I lanthipeptide n=1 Tax=Tenacibaculum sp. TC6 TaxID=3423223 RepID=UPI003D35BF7A